MAAQLPEPHRSTFVALIDEASLLGDERNDQLHALWDGSAQTAFRYRPYWDRDAKELTWRNQAVTPAELDTFTAGLSALSEKIRIARKAWPASSAPSHRVDERRPSGS